MNKILSTSWRIVKTTHSTAKQLKALFCSPVYNFHSGRIPINKTEALGKTIAASWQQKCDAGFFMGLKEETLNAHFGPFTIMLREGRAKRAVSNIFETRRVDREHETKNCPFDSLPNLVGKDGKLEKGHLISRLVLNGRYYYLGANYRPLATPHLLMVKTDGTSRELSQFIQSTEELIDALTLVEILKKDLVVYFNSNPGKRSWSGASVNHWHLQIFQSKNMAALQKTEVLFPSMGGSILARKLPDWPAACREFTGENPYSAAQIAFYYLDILRQENNAYNVVFNKTGKDYRIMVFPRALECAVTPINGEKPKGNYGADAMWGSMVSYHKEEFEAMLSDPAQTEKVLRERLKEVTAAPELMVSFDENFYRKINGDS